MSARPKRKSRFQNASEQEDNSTKRTPPNPHIAAQQSSPKSNDVNSGNKSPEKSGVSPQQETRPESPEPTCSICLGKLENKSFTDSCFHTFCFVCLMEWSKVKAVCPLCKQPFKSIIHNVRSIEDYDQYHLRPEDSGSFGNTDGHRFRYRTTMTLTRHLHHRLDGDHQHYSLQPNSMTTRSQWHRLREAATSFFRRRVYTSGMRVERVETAAGRPTRQREVNPAFFSRNPATMHRLVPWLNRELNVLLGNRADHVQFVLELILDLIKRFTIHSEEFFEHIQPFFGTRTEHFIHEFYSFAKSPYDMVAYDRQAVYSEANAEVETVEESSDSSEGNDSDVIVLSPEGAGETIETEDSSPVPSNNNRPPAYQSLLATHNPEPPSFEMRHQIEWDLTPLFNRVRSFLSTTHDTSVSGWDSPTPGPSSVLLNPSRNASPPPHPERSETRVKTEDEYSQQTSESSSQGTVSLSGSHKSEDTDDGDIIFVGYDKPWEARTPIQLSSDSEHEGGDRVSQSSKRSSHRRSEEKQSKRSRGHSDSDRGSRSRSRQRSSSHKKSHKRDRSRSRNTRSDSRRERSHRSRSRSRNRSDSRREKSYQSSDRSKSGYSSRDPYRYARNRSRERYERSRRTSRSRSRSYSRRRSRSYERRRSPSKSYPQKNSRSESSKHWSSKFVSDGKSKSPRSSLKLRLSKGLERRTLTPSNDELTSGRIRDESSRPQRSSSESVEFLMEKKRKAKHHKHDKDKKHKKHKKHKRQRRDHSESDSDVEIIEQVTQQAHSDHDEGASKYKKHPTGHKKSSKTANNDNDCPASGQLAQGNSEGPSSWTCEESVGGSHREYNVSSDGSVAASSESVVISSPESIVSSVTTWSCATISSHSGESVTVMDHITNPKLPDTVRSTAALPSITSVLPDRRGSDNDSLLSRVSHETGELEIVIPTEIVYDDDDEKPSPSSDSFQRGLLEMNLPTVSNSKHSTSSPGLSDIEKEYAGLEIEIPAESSYCDNKPLFSNESQDSSHSSVFKSPNMNESSHTGNENIDIPRENSSFEDNSVLSHESQDSSHSSVFKSPNMNESSHTGNENIDIPRENISFEDNSVLSHESQDSSHSSVFKSPNMNESSHTGNENIDIPRENISFEDNSVLSHESQDSSSSIFKSPNMNESSHTDIDNIDIPTENSSFEDNSRLSCESRESSESVCKWPDRKASTDLTNDNACTSFLCEKDRELQNDVSIESELEKSSSSSDLETSHISGENSKDSCGVSTSMEDYDIGEVSKVHSQHSSICAKNSSDKPEECDSEQRMNIKNPSPYTLPETVPISPVHPDSSSLSEQERNTTTSRVSVAYVPEPVKSTEEVLSSPLSSGDLNFTDTNQMSISELVCNTSGHQINTGERETMSCRGDGSDSIGSSDRFPQTSGDNSSKPSDQDVTNPDKARASPQFESSFELQDFIMPTDAHEDTLLSGQTISADSPSMQFQNLSNINTQSDLGLGTLELSTFMNRQNIFEEDDD